MSTQKINRRKERAALLSITSNSLLVIGKVAVGFWTGSVGILSEAIHSATDLFASGIAWLSVRKAGKPPDEQHTYGHGKIETLSAFFESLLILSAAFWILWEAFQKLVQPEPIEEISWGLLIMGFSVVVNLFVSKHLFTVGRETESSALIADAYHLSADVWSSIGVFVGLFLIYLTGWYWVDPVIAMVVGLWILRTGYLLAADGIANLIDMSLPEEEEKQIREILDADPRICTYHQLRSRKSGSMRLVDVHIHLEADLTLEEAHRITDEVETLIEIALPNVDVIIHAEPCSPEEIQKKIDLKIAERNGERKKKK